MNCKSVFNYFLKKNIFEMKIGNLVNDFLVFRYGVDILMSVVLVWRL